MNVGHEPSRSTPSDSDTADNSTGIPPMDAISPAGNGASGIGASGISANSFGESAGLVGAASHAGAASTGSADISGREPAGITTTPETERTTATELADQRDIEQGGIDQQGIETSSIDPTQPLGASVEASTRLIETFQAGVWRYLRALGCDAALAEDLTQETFVAVLQRPFTDHGAMATGAYLRRVAHNLYVTFRRRHGRMLTTEDVEEISHAWERWAGQDQGEELIEILNDCLSRLTDRARKALEMRFRGEHSRNEIAEFLTITEHGAKNLMQRAKHQLRECIERKLNRP